MFRRVLLFMAVNVLVVLTISLVLAVLGVNRYGGLGGMIAFGLVWGFTGSLVSLAISRFMAKMAYGVKLVDDGADDPRLRELVRTVHDLSRAAGLTTMPEVGVYASPEVNAFATGPTRSRALVAVSTGLLESMDRREVRGVLAHEVSHVANGDMVTMALLQGVVNAFVFVLARVAAGVIVRDSKSRNARAIVTWLLELGLSLLGMLAVMAFSRWREYRADAGAAELAGRDSMIAALRRLQAHVEFADPRGAALASMKISGAPKWFALFASHPPLEDRIARLQDGR